MSDISQLLPRHAQIYLDLRQQLATMTVGTKLASERQLALEFGVNRLTLRRVLRDLCEEGVLETRHGLGTFLRKQVKIDVSIKPDHDTTLIGMVVPTVNSPAIAKMVTGAEAEAAERHFSLVLSHDHGDYALQFSQIRKLQNLNLAGLICYPHARNPEQVEYLDLLRQIQARRTALVLVDRYVPGLQAPCVLSDNNSGMYQATEHLILLGRRKFLMLCLGDSGGISDQGRRQGMLRAIQDYGLSADQVIQKDVGVEQHEVTVKAAIDLAIAETAGRGLPFDALVCHNDGIAFHAFLALQSRGIRVPEDVAIVGYNNDDQELFRRSGLHLTSVDPSPEVVGRSAMKLLIDEIKGNSAPTQPRHMLVKPVLVVRTSCGSASSRRTC